MKLFDYEPKVEIVAASGRLRVTIQPKPSLFLMLFEAAGIIVCLVIAIREWSVLSYLLRALLAWVECSTVVAWFYQLSGSEEVEFDSQKLTVRKNTFAWQGTKEYSVLDCRELEWEAPSKHERQGLKCKSGWRTIHFGDYVSEVQANQIMTALQETLPDVFRTMGPMPSFGKSFVTLGLSK